MTDLNKLFAGRTIAGASHMDAETAEQIGWTSRPLIIRFTDGSFMYAQSDDEGNDGGALAMHVGEDMHIAWTQR